MIPLIDITIRNEISEISTVRDALDQLGNEFEVPGHALAQLQVATDELLSNIIKYSWADGSEHKVLVRIELNATGVSLDLFDDGQPFDPRQAPRPNVPPPGQRPLPGGLGVQLVKQLVDNLAYERINGRNHTRLTKNCAVGRTPKRIVE